MARDVVETNLSTIRGRNVTSEIAFFGGSFTGIERELMISLLDLAEEYVKRGEVQGIRMSTRPDYINEEIIEILKKYTISAVELGIQSMSDFVLSTSKRGHTTETSRVAVKMLRDAGFNVVGQMMVGLPGSSRVDEE
jgi:histone acetyltransferase (RNA polymerase elongator complex component)